MTCDLLNLVLLRVPVECSAERLQCNEFSLQVFGCLRNALGLAEVAPIIFVGAESADYFSRRGKTQIRGDDGERSVFGQHAEQTRRNNVDAGEAQRIHFLAASDKFWLIAAELSSTKLQLVIEQQAARRLTILHRERG